jgi:hypothetical protein
MPCHTNLPTLRLTAGQISAIELEFRDPAGVAVDLAGTTARLMAKRSLSDPDAEAVLDLSQADHTEAAAGRTALPVDLSGLPADAYAAGLRLTGSLWLEDGAGARIPYGLLAVEIVPSALRWEEEEEN